MPLTPIQALQLVKDNGIVVKQHPDGGWHTTGKDGGRLGGKGSKPTYEGAVEAAYLQLVESENRSLAADKSRLFDILSDSNIYVRDRKTTIIDEDGKPIQIKVWDVFKSSNNSQIVTGERSLIAAIIEAEKVGI